MDIGISGKRAVVCGGSRGMSRAAADRLAAEGVQVTLVARTVATLESAAAEIAETTGVHANFFATDLTTAEGRAALLEAFPDTDILITNAGAPQRSVPYQSLDRDGWNWWFEAHFFSAIDLIHAYAPGMTERGFGRIVNISANFIKFPQVGVGHSHAARLALAGAIASLVREVASRNVTINSILPGLVNTDALQAALRERAADKEMPYQEVENAVKKRCAADRIADPREIGDLIAMLCAAQMGYVTGQNIVCDGGAFEGLF